MIIIIFIRNNFPYSFTQSCHSDEGGIFVARSTQIDILCGATYEDSSFIRMTNITQKTSHKKSLNG
ncbi:hypothetical protein BXU10_18725 [Flavobacterium sp. LM4]|nr:hypothetical protein BXU10_18725 [Flavobacterium sp. LM4]